MRSPLFLETYLFSTFAFLCPALAEHTVFVVAVRNGSQLTGVPWDLRLAGHTSATHIFLVCSHFQVDFSFRVQKVFQVCQVKLYFYSSLLVGNELASNTLCYIK